ncbi:MAG: alanine racemase [Desulfobacterales bacterium]
MDTSCTRAEIDLRAVARNTRELRRITNPKARMMAVVKANAYGHGVLKISKTVLANGADALGVARIDEALLIRNSGIDAPILILGYTSPDHTASLIRYDLTQTIGSREFAESFSEAAGKEKAALKIQLKIDSGMGRLGFMPDRSNAFSRILKEMEVIIRLPNLLVQGIYTHFARADLKDKTSSYQQLEIFNELVERLHLSMGFETPIRHAANSAAVIDMPDTHLDMVRPGIALYGLYPSQEVDRNKILLQPVMELKSRILHLKKVPAGFPVSYGGTWRATKKTTIATVPIGYADGYNRLLSSTGHMLVCGKKAPIAGRVCMDLTMLDVGDIPETCVNDEVVVFGRQENASIFADEIAKTLGTINYEIVSTITERVPRVFF